jgi:hypothetical protein
MKRWKPEDPNKAQRPLKTTRKKKGKLKKKKKTKESGEGELGKG